MCRVIVRVRLPTRVARVLGHQKCALRLRVPPTNEPHRTTCAIRRCSINTSTLYDHTIMFFAMATGCEGRLVFGSISVLSQHRVEVNKQEWKWGMLPASKHYRNSSTVRLDLSRANSARTEMSCFFSRVFCSCFPSFVLSFSWDVFE